MNKAQVVKSLHEEERRLRNDLKRVELALQAFGREEAAQHNPSRKQFRLRISGVCLECKNKYTAKKTNTKFCSQPCRAKWWTREHARLKVQAAAPSKPRPAVLLPGDPLRAGSKS